MCSKDLQMSLVMSHKTFHHKSVPTPRMEKGEAGWRQSLPSQDSPGVLFKHATSWAMDQTTESRDIPEIWIIYKTEDHWNKGLKDHVAVGGRGRGHIKRNRDGRESNYVTIMREWQWKDAETPAPEDSGLLPSFWKTTQFLKSWQNQASLLDKLMFVPFNYRKLWLDLKYVQKYFGGDTPPCQR